MFVIPGDMSAVPTTAIRPAAHFLLLPFIYFLHHLGHYGSRAILYPFCRDLGLDYFEIPYSFFREFGVGVGLAVAVGLVLGPHGAMIGGLALNILGLVLLIVAGAFVEAGILPYEFTPMLLGVPLVLSAIGSSMFRCSGYAVAAISIVGPNALLRTSLFFGMFLAANFSGFLAPHGGFWAYHALGYTVTFGLLALLMTLALVLALPLVVAEWFPPRMAKDRTRALDLKPLVAGLGLGAFAAPLALYWVAMDFGPLYDIDPDLPSRLWTINPLVAVFVCGAMALVLLPFGVFRFRFPELFIAGTGFLLTAAGVATIALAGLVPTFVLYIGVAIAAVGECLAAAVVASRMLGDTHWRLVTAIAAASHLVTLITMSLSYGVLMPLSLDVLGFNRNYPAIATSVLASLLGAVVLLAAAWPLHQYVYGASPAGQGSSAFDYRRVAKTISEWSAKLAAD